MKRSKRFLSAGIVAVVILLVAGAALFASLFKPLKSLNADDVLYVDVSVIPSSQYKESNRYYNPYKRIYKTSDIDKITYNTREIAVYKKVKKYKYDGQVAIYTFSMKSGVTKEFIILSSKTSVIKIDNIFYKINGKTARHLITLFGELNYEVIEPTIPIYR